MTTPLAEHYGVEWLLEICERAGKGALPDNIDARCVARTVNGLLDELEKLRATQRTPGTVEVCPLCNCRIDGGLCCYSIAARRDISHAPAKCPMSSASAGVRS